MPKFFKVPFALSGTKTDIPEAVQPDGSVSYTDGYSIKYSLNRVTDPTALTIERDKMNDLFYDVTDNIKQYQTLGTPEFITTADNGGTAYSYSKGARVRYNPGAGMNVYISKVDTNTALPTNTTNWLLETPGFAVLPNADYGDITASGSGTTLTIDAGVVTYAKMQNIATKTFIGRNTAATGVPEAVTITQALDWATGTPAQGNVLFRGASAWQLLAPGTSGNVLTTNGAAADPTWTTRGNSRLVSTVTISPGTSVVDFNNLVAGRNYSVSYYGVFGSSASDMGLRTSTDNGSTFASGASDYTTSYIVLNNTTLTNTTVSSSYILITPFGYGTTASQTCEGKFSINGPMNATYLTKVFGIGTGTTAAATLTYESAGSRVTAQANNAIRLFPATAGTFSGGVIQLWEEF